MTRAALAKELRARRVIDGSLVSYMKKKDLIKMLGFADKVPEGKRVELPEEYVQKLNERKKEHQQRTRSARVERNARHGTTNLTKRELLLHIVNSCPGLTFVEQRVYDEPFESPTGNTKGAKVANVFRDANGEEHLFTRAECRTLNKDLGVDMPKKAFQHAKKSPAEIARKKGATTFGDLW